MCVRCSEGYDEESPLVEPREACPHEGAANGDGDDLAGSSPAAVEAGPLSDFGLPPVQLPQEGVSHGRGVSCSLVI